MPEFSSYACSVRTKLHFVFIACHNAMACRVYTVVLLLNRRLTCNVLLVMLNGSPVFSGLGQLHAVVKHHFICYFLFNETFSILGRYSIYFS